MRSKGILQLLVSVMMAATAVIPVQAGELPVTVVFTDPGLLDGTQDDTFRTVSVWQNDTAYLRLRISTAEDISLSVSAECGDPGIRIDLYELMPVSASLGTGDPSVYPHISVPDRMEPVQEMDLHAGEERWVAAEIRTEETAAPGSHTGTIRWTDGTDTVSEDFGIHVRDLVVPGERMSLDLWQYPWSSYYYYDSLQGKEPFGPEHLAVLQKEMELYRDLGGNTITVSIIDEPWSHQTYFDTPSLITWNRDENGYIWFDFTYFDRWVELCTSLGIDGRIESFSILPFANVLYIHGADGSTERLMPEVGSYEWNTIWGLFLEKYTEHLKEKGWLERTCMFIDERNEADMRTAAELIRSYRDADGNGLKLACALNTIPQDRELAEMMDYISLSVGTLPEDDPEFYAYLQTLRNKGIEVTLYNCSTVYPNAFAFSEPNESVWTMAYIRSLGLDGYLRWAYNAWTADPLHTFDFENFEAGDTYLIYPDERDSADPVPVKSYRLCMIEEGMQEAAKYTYLMEHAGRGYIRRLLEDNSPVRRAQGRWNAYGAVTAGSQADKDLITAEVKRLGETIDRAAVLEEILPGFLLRLMER